MFAAFEIVSRLLGGEQEGNAPIIVFALQKDVVDFVVFNATESLRDGDAQSLVSEFRQTGKREDVVLGANCATPLFFILVSSHPAGAVVGIRKNPFTFFQGVPQITGEFFCRALADLNKQENSAIDC
jgi:hypothetical protein